MIRLVLDGQTDTLAYVQWPHCPPEGATVEFRGARWLAGSVVYGHTYTEDNMDENSQMVTIVLTAHPDGA